MAGVSKFLTQEDRISYDARASIDLRRSMRHDAQRDFVVTAWHMFLIILALMSTVILVVGTGSLVTKLLQ